MQLGVLKNLKLSYIIKERSQVEKSKFKEVNYERF